MATVTVSIGSNQSIDTETTASCSGSDPYVATFGTTPSGIAVGDLATGSDAFASTFIWLVTAIDGDDITFKYVSGGMGAASPCSIGSFGGGGVITFKRYYSTITLWEAGLDDTGLYSSGDDAVGECYDDSTFNEQVTINDGDTVGLDSVTLSVASGERHDGTAGSGARLVLTGNLSGGQSKVLFDIDYEMDVTVEWLEFDGAGYGGTGSNTYIFDLGGVDTASDYKTVSKCIIHHFSNKYKCYTIRTHDTRSDYKINNNFIYNMQSSNAGSSAADNVAIEIYNPRNNSYYHNNTIHDLWTRDAVDESGDIVMIETDNDAQAFCNNNLVTGPGRNAGGVCFDSADPTGDYSNNLSSDDTADGTDCLINKSAADQYESSTVDSEDLHLKSGADAIGAGKDVGTTGDANVDINGRDRHSEGDTWDIGAHQTEPAAAATANPAFLMFVDT